MQEAALLDGAAGLVGRDFLERVAVAAAAVAGGCAECVGVEVRDVFWLRMLRANGGHAGVGRLAGFAECVVARVKVLAFLEIDV